MRLAILVALFSLLQTTLLGEMDFRGARPDLLLPLVVIFSTRTDKNSACVLGWTVGIVKDMLSGTPFGTYALLYAVAALICTHIAEKTFVNNAVVIGVISFFVALLVNAGCILITALRLHISPGCVYKGLLSSLFIAVAAVAVALITGKSSRWLRLRKEMVF